MKKFSLRKLMKLFVAIFSGIIILAATFYIMATINNFKSETTQIQNSAVSRVSTEVQKNVLITNNISDFISENISKVSNIEEYLKNEPSNYAQYILNHEPYFNWPTISQNFFIKDSNLDELQVRMMDSNNIFRATARNTSGKIVNVQKKDMTNMFYSSIINPQQETVVGIVGTKFNTEALKKSLAQLQGKRHMQVWALTDDDRPVFQYYDRDVSNKEKDIVRKAISEKRLTKIPGFTSSIRTIDNQYKVLVLFEDKAMGRILFKRISLILIIATLVLLVLFLSFMAIFNRYRKQLNRIISTTQAISKNNSQTRISMLDASFEDLTILSKSINKMLDEITNNVNTIYKLRLAQQEAHMKALQAQISPHFMANTLEYIRMSAVDLGENDLAKVVYNFAALLRSNVSSQVQTTLKQEAKLVGNYVYLYQVRFPDKFAYQISISKELKQVKLPKFSLQPLVENYFVHGVNFANNNNALELRGVLKENRVVIEVIDNGKHLQKDVLERLNEKIKQPIVGDKSIGLQNVYARMKKYTNNFTMKIGNNIYGGVTVQLSFDYGIRE